MMAACQAENTAAITRSATAPAKLNLTLRVLGRRPDGFHELESFLVPIDLCDELFFTRVARESPVLECDSPDVPLGGENLVLRAVRELESCTEPLSQNIESQNVDAPASWHIRLTKRVPIGAGLGGGSSDAAATLKAIKDWDSNEASVAQLTNCAARLGSDVPFFLHDSPAIVRGRGECVTPAEAPFSGGFLLVFPGFACSTRHVFEAFDHHSDRRDRPIDPFADPPPHNAEQLADRLFNDLTKPAFRVYPELERLCGELQQTLGLALHLTGTGSTLFCPVDTADQARVLAETIRQVLDLNSLFTRLRF